MFCNKPGIKHHLVLGCNIFRITNGRNYYNEVNNQNLTGFNLTQSDMNTAIIGNPNSQPMDCSDKVLHPYRVGSNLTTREDQGKFNYPVISQLAPVSRAGYSNTDYQPMYCSDKVLNPYRVGLDLTTQEDQGEFNSHLVISQSCARSRTETSNIDFSKSMKQLLGSLGDLNENLREGFGILADCSDNWRHTMGSRLTSHEDRLLK